MLSWIIDRQRTGVDTYLYNLLTSMIELGKSNDIFLIHYKKTNDRVYTLANDIIVPNVPRILKYSIGIPYAIKKANLDVLHAPIHWYTQITPFFLNYNVKKVLTIHDLTPILFPKTHTKQTVQLWNPTLKLIKNKIDIIIADSNNTKNDCIKYLGIPEERIKVICLAPNEIFTPQKNKEKLRSYLQNKFDLNFPFILSVGTLEKRKNIPNLLKAFYKLKKTDKNHKLVIVGGKGWRYEGIFDYLCKLNLEKDVIFTGYISDEDLFKFYNTADLFVYPSLYEGFGLPPLEAMACGCPVITSNTSSLPEVIGDAGIMIDPTDSDALFDAIHRILNDDDLKAELSKKSLQRAKMFSWKKTARETWKVYEKVLE